MIYLLLLSGCGDFTRDTSDTAQGCSDPAECPLRVSDPVVACGDTGSTGASALSVEQVGLGTLGVTHVNFRTGCCPDFSATANANQGESPVDVYYSLTDDTCECVCQLSLSYTLDKVKPGDWTVAAGFDVALVTVE